jgi:aspartyl protease family protein
MRRPSVGVAGFAGVVLTCLIGASAWAQSVSLTGTMGRRATLVIEGRSHVVDVGQSVNGVKLLNVTGDAAEVSFAGKKQQLTVGAKPARLDSGTAAPVAAGSEIVLPAGPGGHFFAQGSINGKSIGFVVDTGATVIAMSEVHATELGLNLTGARRGLSQTANGVVPTRVINLDRVRIGDVEIYNVEALVLPAGMQHVLLGNSFLSRFRMTRDADVLRLIKR